MLVRWGFNNLNPKDGMHAVCPKCGKDIYENDEEYDESVEIKTQCENCGTKLDVISKYDLRSNDYITVYAEKDEFYEEDTWNS